MIRLNNIEGDIIILPTDSRVKNAELLIFLFTDNKKEDIYTFNLGYSLVLTTNAGVEYSSRLSALSIYNILENMKTNKAIINHNGGAVSLQLNSIQVDTHVEMISVDEKDDISLYELFGLNDESNLHVLEIPCMKVNIMTTLQNDVLDYIIVIKDADLKQLSVKNLDLLNPNQYKGKYCIKLENIEKYLKGDM